ncbi:MAG TPA: hypothetical protein VIY48_07850 [Candidatus Paceibacterota bacterium]
MELRTKAEIAAVMAFCVVLWQVSRPKTEPTGTTTSATTAPELKGADKQDITPPKVPVYTLPAKQKLQLPPDVQDDPNKYVLASSKLPNDTHTHTVTTVIDQKTGQAQTYDRRDPYPWLAAEQSGSLWVGYGIKNGGYKVWQAVIQEDVFQVKAVHFGITATLASDGTAFAGIGASVKW